MGTPSSTLKGSVQLSYCAAMMRKTTRKDNAEDDHGAHALRGLDLLVGHAHVIEAHLRGHGLVERIFESCESLRGAVSGSGGAVDLDALEEVVLHDEFSATGGVSCR